MGTDQAGRGAQIAGMALLAAIILSIIIALGPSTMPGDGDLRGIDIMATDD